MVLIDPVLAAKLLTKANEQKMKLKKGKEETRGRTAERGAVFAHGPIPRAGHVAEHTIERASARGECVRRVACDQRAGDAAACQAHAHLVATLRVDVVGDDALTLLALAMKMVPLRRWRGGSWLAAPRKRIFAIRH